MGELNNVDENSLGISNIDKLQIKAIKEMRERILKLEKKSKQKWYMLCQRWICVICLCANLIILYSNNIIECWCLSVDVYRLLQSYHKNLVYITLSQFYEKEWIGLVFCCYFVNVVDRLFVYQCRLLLNEGINFCHIF